MQDRTLLISPDGPYLVYPYYEKDCKVLIFCQKHRKMLKYDLRDEETRKMLINMGFQVQSTQRFDYK